MDIANIFEKVGQVKLRGGIFGKTAWVLIVCFICVTALAISSGEPYIIGATILLIMLFSLIIIFKLLNFAEKNPQIAILDGAEFLMHEQIVHASKGQGILPAQPSVIDHTQPGITLDASESDEDTDNKKIGGAQ